MIGGTSRGHRWQSIVPQCAVLKSCDGGQKVRIQGSEMVSGGVILKEVCEALRSKVIVGFVVD